MEASKKFGSLKTKLNLVLLCSDSRAYITCQQKKIIENLVKIKNDGTVELDVDRSAHIVPNLFGLDTQAQSDIDQSCEIRNRDVPSRLNIAILIVGTRGDVQPFVAIGKRLKVSINSLILLHGSNGSIYSLPLFLI
jgi:hypothetical protein